MTLQQFAAIINVSCIGIVLAMSALVLRRHPVPFFRAWTLGYLSLFLMMLSEGLVAALGRNFIFGLVEVVLVWNNTWFFSKAARLLMEQPFSQRVYWGGLLVYEALAIILQLAGLPFYLAIALQLLLLSASFQYLSYSLFRTQRLDGGGWLGIPMILLSLLPYSYTYLEGTPFNWVGFWAASVLHMVVGTGMVIFLLQRAENALQEKNQQLALFNQMKSSLLSTVSHELRTPVTNIKGYLELLEDQIPGPLNEKQGAFVGDMLKSTGRLNDLINGMLDSYLVESGTFKVVTTRVTLSDSLHQAILNVRSACAKKGLDLELVSPSELPHVQADPLRLMQVLNQLLDNAVKFTDAGGIKVEVQREGDRVRISVQDTGIGIPKGQEQHIFDAFYQVDGTLTRKHGGTGLGLSITRQLLQAMDGEVEVSSEEGKGSRFTFTLPIAPEEPSSLLTESLPHEVS